MTRREALAVNKVLLALLAQKQTLSMVGIGIGITALEGDTMSAAAALADAARERVGVGLDSHTVKRVWQSPRELQRVLAEMRKEAMERCA